MSIVTVNEAKRYLQISHQQDDTLIQELLDEEQSIMGQALSLHFFDGDAEAGGGETVQQDLDGGALNLRPTILPVLKVLRVADLHFENAETESGYDEIPIDEIQWTKWRVFRNPSETAKALRLGECPEGFEPGKSRWRLTFNAGYNATTAESWMKGCLKKLVYGAYWGRPDSGKMPSRDDILRAYKTGSMKLPLG